MNWKVFGRMVAVSFLAIAAVAVVVGVFSRNRKGWTEWEQKVISLSDSLMYVTVLPEDSLILRTPSADLSESMLRSPQLKILLDKMLYTVQDPSQDGVGIAAPQVGINRRIVCVQRFDKPGEPFECYLNVRAELLASSIAAVRKREHDMVLGNIIGSNLFNTLAVVGLACVITPMTEGVEKEAVSTVIRRDFPVDGLLTVALLLSCIPWKRGGRAVINRWEGAFLLLAYAAYLGLLIHDAAH